MVPGGQIMQMSMGVIIKGATAAGTLRGEMSDGTYGSVHHVVLRVTLKTPQLRYFITKDKYFWPKS